MYLWRRTNGYCFQLRVPKKYQVYLRSTPLRVFLGSIDKRSAARIATILAAHAFKSMSAAEDMDRKALESSLKALSAELQLLEKKRRISALKALQLQTDVEQSLIDKSDSKTHDLSEWSLSEESKYALQSADKETALKNAYAATLERLNFLKGVLEKDQIAAESEKIGLHSALRTVASLHTMSPATTQLPQNVPQAAAEALSVTEDVDDGEITANTRLSIAAEVVLSARRRAKGDGSAPDRYQERLETAVAAFIDVIGDLPLRKYLPIHMQDFATVMAEIPRNRSKYPEFKGVPLRKIAEKNRKRKPSLPCLGVTTIQGTVSEVLNLWGRVTAGIDGVKDLKSYRIVMPSAATKRTVREGLPTVHLNKWITAAAAQKPRDAHKRWLPMVGMLTGMRLGEIVWLQVSDLAELDGHTVIDLRRPLVIDRKEVDRRLKTETSPRIVGLPSFLIEAGFVDYARNVRKRGFVFSAFHTADDPADAASKQMTNWMKKLGIHERQRQTFHSLRHNAKHWYANEFGERTADRQLGHAPANVSRSYGFPVLQSEEIEKIAAMPIPRGLDLSPFGS
ncbi:Site-specific recombinase XerD [Pannonibacter phragmitetus]|uniref:Site-specific recombinase XerD n=1 Tax=Pannonibacter phragmitetus TaxID=121719 RepID=A0A378ZXX5_9HYPH|nr:tyrosine-type recombinase/integrase [Pannonibacter phragmitetus]SUB01928.1 Site-specific recombinase XerD [Pannonibacter phragmitetus]